MTIFDTYKKEEVINDELEHLMIKDAKESYDILKKEIEVCSKCGEELIEEEELHWGIHEKCEFPNLDKPQQDTSED